MSRARTCPLCSHPIGQDEGKDFRFDASLNLICMKCGQVAFPTEYDTDLKLETAVRDKNKPPASKTSAYKSYPSYYSGSTFPEYQCKYYPSSYRPPKPIETPQSYRMVDYD